MSFSDLLGRFIVATSFCCWLLGYTQTSILSVFFFQDIVVGCFSRDFIFFYIYDLLQYVLVLYSNGESDLKNKNGCGILFLDVSLDQKLFSFWRQFCFKLLFVNGLQWLCFKIIAISFTLSETIFISFNIP